MSINRAKVQAFGGFLTAMVIPNMGAFIAWGFLTALFIPTGWIPNEAFSSIVGPMIIYVLPLLLAYTGGRLVHQDRGAVAGVIGTIGLIVGASIPMFLGAMIMGPLSAYIVKKFDELVEGKIPVGFEMVVNNFSLGIIGLLLILGSFSVVGPLIESANTLVTTLIEALVKTGFLPILALINEPAKVLFLNNVIDQGIYYPLGMQEAVNLGKSIYFTVASNPGSGLGLLLAFMLFGEGMPKKSASGAIIIHFFGGIHEIYFPYVLMKPIMIIPMIVGSASGIFMFDLFNAGLVAGPSPGSIFAYLALTPRGNFIGIIAGVLTATVVSFLIASFILKTSKKKEGNFEEYKESAKEMKAEGKAVLAGALSSKSIELIAFACDAGLGSSALGANAFRKRLENEGKKVKVANYPIEKIPNETGVVVTHSSLVERTRLKYPNVRIVAIESFINDKALDELFVELTSK
jgi:mannitol PTS system EIICBA or EIICB component